MIIFLSNFITLLYALRYYAFNEALLYGWLQSVALSFFLGFGVIDVLAITIRNNTEWLRPVLQSKRYQVFEKFVTAPILRALTVVYKQLAKIIC